MYVVGYDRSHGNCQWRIEKRSLTDGSLVPAFGTYGVVTSNPDIDSNDEAYGIAIDSTAMYVAGYDYSPGNYQWRIEKRSLIEGNLVGVYTSNPSAWLDEAYDIAIDSTTMYVVGYDHSTGYAYGPQNTAWRIEKRSLTDGNLVGVYTSNPSTWLDEAYAIAIDSTMMYVVGYDQDLVNDPDYPENYQWRIEKRSLIDGSLVLGFGIAGVVTSDPSTRDDMPRGIAIDSTAIYVVGYERRPEGNYQWRIEKRVK
jgi:hypothetical protein